MAINSQSRRMAELGKRFVSRIWSAESTRLSSSYAVFDLRRGLHNSVYDKNVDDQLRPNHVPDELIHPLSDKYWSPHPQTGVFGPAAEQNGPANVACSYHTPSADGGAQNVTVLEQTAWFRPLEDVDKPRIELS
ncbi:hypothetical protein GIB67_038853 [Kingdonia uniflora]|uniref:Late embryogenesis abundant protein n=1 Tax=Kingdonia uniflora TaxID=39325 RepID=A0A7J7L1P2_9MAGN|nr:hypothetical protein GIB67_028129 [Kingdonia uniflora]KAF6136533.1 hypothetical protein GIB67_038853 [Kingdonia uniflora]